MNNTFRRASAFISSTFADMTNERNLMVYNVLPRVKKWAFDRGIIFDIIDLRWGINDEQAKDLHHTIKLCLQRVKDSDPIFICFLGERYGWIPPIEDFNQGMFDKSIAGYENLSATELEIAEALDGIFLDSLPKTCMFFLREDLDFTTVPEDIKTIYRQESYFSKLQRLKKALEAREGIDKSIYSAELVQVDNEYILDNFLSNDKSLEEVIFEKLTIALTKKYALDSKTLIGDDIISRQHYHQNELMLYPIVPRHQATLRNFLDSTPQYAYTSIGIATYSAIPIQIAHFLKEESQLKNQRVIYRFWGKEFGIDSVNDLICSIAYEFSGNKEDLNNSLKSLFYLKSHLEQISTETLFVGIGIPSELLPNLCNCFAGLKWARQLYFYDVEFSPDDLYIDYDRDSFLELAKYFFESRAKHLTSSQLSKVVEAADNNILSLKIIVDYLCNFACYETLDKMINELASFGDIDYLSRFEEAFESTYDPFVSLENVDVASKYVTSLVALQNTHAIKNIMLCVIELLCNTPVAISRKDIVDTICLTRNIDKESDIIQVEREVSFSLRLIYNIVEEYNSHFKINNLVIKTTVDILREDHYKGQPIAHILTLRQVYVDRLKDEKCTFDKNDGQNFLEIIKQFPDDCFNQNFSELLKDFAIFYKLFTTLGKWQTLKLFKVLAMQDLGYSTSKYSAEKKSLKSELNIYSSVIEGKIFSSAKVLHSDNTFMKYYLALQKVNDEDISSSEQFERAFRRLFGEKDGCHRIILPDTLNISYKNSCAATSFSPTQQEYLSYICLCQNGFLVILDAITGKMVEAFAIARGFGEVTRVFYQEHTVHIVFENGVLCAVNLWSKDVRMFRILPDGFKVNFFESYYNNGCQVAVADYRRVVLYKSGMPLSDMMFNERLQVISAYGLNAKDGVFDKVCIVAKSRENDCRLLTVDMVNHDVIDVYIITEGQIVLTHQDENANDIHVIFDNTSYLVTIDKEGLIDIEKTSIPCFYSNKNHFVIKQKNKEIISNDKIIASGENIRRCFSSGDVIIIVTDNNFLYLIDTEAKE